MCKIRSSFGPNRFGRIARKILFPPRMRPGYDFFNFYMNGEMADWIYAQCVQGASTQRALSRDFKEKYPESNVQSECQIDGQDLQRYLEDYKDICLDTERENCPEYHESISIMAKQIKEMFDKIKNSNN